MLPVITLEAALGIAGGALLGAIVMLVLWLRARSALSHVVGDLKSLQQLARRERTDLERQLEGYQRKANELSLRSGECSDALETLTADHRQLQEAHTGLRAAYLDAMGGGAPPSVQLRSAAAPLTPASRLVAVEIGRLAAEMARCRDGVHRCRDLMDDLMHDMQRAIDLGRRLSPPADHTGGFFQALEEGLVSLDAAIRENRGETDALVERVASLTQHAAAMTAVSQSHHETVDALTSRWQQLEAATSGTPTEPST